jgi:hypothetical protein
MLKRLVLIVCILGAIGYAYWKLVIPTHRVEVSSELVMLGDLDDDHRWTKNDLTILDTFLQDPFSMPDSLTFHIDMNQNGLIDEEDLDILRSLVSAKGDPYAAEDAALAAGKPFPRPRECYRYIPLMEYRVRPLFALPYPLAGESDIDWIVKLKPPVSTIAYGDALDAALYSEAIRLDQAWRERKPDLLPIEREYAAKKLARAKALFQAGERYELLLALMELVEDAETLTERGQPEAPVKMLTFRDHLREILGSPLYDDFKSGKKDWRALLDVVSGHLKTDLGLVYDFDKLGPPRNLTHLENYLQRAEWQYYKSTNRKVDFIALIGYAQHDPRYLRAVARTSRKSHLIISCSPETRRTAPIRAGTGTFSAASVSTSRRKRLSTWRSDARCRTSVRATTPKKRCANSSGT